MHKATINKRYLGVGIGLLGVVLAYYEGSILAYERSFTEAAEGLVVVSSANDLIVRFSPVGASHLPTMIQQPGDADYAFPRDERTAALKVGDVIRAYYPPGKLREVRLDRDFTTWIPAAAAGLGWVLTLGGIAIAVFSGHGPGKSNP